MHLRLGNGEFASFKVSDFAAYERQMRRLLAAAIDRDPAAEVYPGARSSTVPSAGGVSSVPGAGGPTTTCRWWPG